MATILFNTSKASPISYYIYNYLPIHNPNGVDAFIIKKALWSTHLISLDKSYNLVKSNWNNYYKLVDLLELSLKNTNNYIKAIQSFIKLPKIKSYLKQYIIPIPADFLDNYLLEKQLLAF
ncbi:hypothetical protein RhiirA4_470774 [Rhizophagus irregularis]|uniref:Uncharacterized protein n=1 Tax=Rhizophagus irregularis TaxID=588596 RepID=A0A2I1H1V5_9GLOM|nr:hypothetical protein RhiirA4_470774 [Rhizophagus irregularis]